MDITQVVALSRDQALPQSSSLPNSDQNEPINVASGMHLLILVLFHVFDAYNEWPPIYLLEVRR